MTDSRNCDVLIAGAGPAGLATALYLLRQHPELAGRIVALERGHHPRPKVCAGGLIPHTIAALDELRIGLDVPSVQVYGGAAQTEAGIIDLCARREPLCTIVRRDEFDAMLAQQARRAGLIMVEDTRVLGAAQDVRGVTVATDHGHFNGKVLVGADGSGSRVRRTLFGRDKHNIGRALMAEVAVNPRQAQEFVRRRYRFDFKCVTAGVNGYCWSFPCLIDRQPFLNIGIYEQNPRREWLPQTKPDLLRELRKAFPEVDSIGPTGAIEFQAFPIRWYDRQDSYVRGNTILVGDAAGVDPLMGEGISCAFEHGKLAAAAISRYLQGEHSALSAYGEELHNGLTGRKLRRLGFAARRFYGRHHRFYFHLAAFSRVAQKLGVDWYNGAHGADELSIFGAMLRLGRSLLIRDSL